MAGVQYDLVDYKPKAKENPYTDHVAALLKAGEGKAATIYVDHGTGKRQRVIFQQAAIAAGKTARVVETGETPEYETITFVLKERKARAKTDTVDA